MARDGERFEHTLGDADALMWNIDRDPQLRSTIVTALVLDRSPVWADVVQRFARGTRLIPRLRQRVVEPALRIGPPAWSADPDFDLAYHLRRVRAPKPRSFDAVLDIAATAAMGDFDRARPLWECTMVEGLPDGRAAVVLKVHHSMSDGVGGMKLLLMLFDLERNPPEGAPDPETASLPTYTPANLVVHGVEWQAQRAASTARSLGSGAIHAARSVRDDTARTLEGAARTVGSVARFLQPASHPLSPVISSRSLDRRLGTLVLPLDDLKRAAKAAGGTLNDAFVAGVLGGLRRYHAAEGGEVGELRMMMPINIRPEHAGLGGNHFTTARMLVPLMIDDPGARIREISVRCKQLRAEPAVALSEQLAMLLNRLPRRVATALFGGVLKGADFITSNVPGSPFPLYLCGAEVQEIYAFGPLSGAAANLVLLSHCGTCFVGVNTDARAIPDTVGFAAGLRASFEEVLALA
ncbi:MAG: wax ester/triacylglycerol synthase family O-acyltransferase [Acidimicrobiia bacterium]